MLILKIVNEIIKKLIKQIKKKNKLCIYINLIPIIELFKIINEFYTYKNINLV